MPSILSGSARRKQSNGGGDRTQLYLNVYDLASMNKYMYWFGLGIYHSGIEVHGTEYAFGAHEHPTSGVFEVEPKNCPGFVIRRSVWLGSINMSRTEFRLFMERLSGKYNGDTYHLIAKNCNHFTDDVCKRLTGKSIPGWVNRIARLGSFCKCLLPESIQVTAVRHLPEHLAYSGTGFSSAFSTDDLDSLRFGSFASSDITKGDDDTDHRLLTTANGDVAFLGEKPVRRTMESP